MSWFKQRWVVLTEAVGVRRFVLGSLTLTLIALYGEAREFCARYHLTLPDLPHWGIAVAVFAALLIWWLLNYAAELKKQAEPTIILEAVRDIERATELSPKQLESGEIVLGHVSRPHDFVLKIRNSGPTSLLGCLAKVNDIHGRKIGQIVTPRALKTYRQHEDKREEAGRFDLRPGEPKDILLCTIIVEGNNVSPTFLNMQYENLPPDLDTHLSPNRRYEIEVGIYGAPKATEFKLVMGLNSSGRYVVEPLIPAKHSLLSRAVSLGLRRPLSDWSATSVVG